MQRISFATLGLALTFILSPALKAWNPFEKAKCQFGCTAAKCADLEFGKKCLDDCGEDNEVVTNCRASYYSALNAKTEADKAAADKEAADAQTAKVAAEKALADAETAKIAADQAIKKETAEAQTAKDNADRQAKEAASAKEIADEAARAAAKAATEKETADGQVKEAELAKTKAEEEALQAAKAVSDKTAAESGLEAAKLAAEKTAQAAAKAADDKEAADKAAEKAADGKAEADKATAEKAEADAKEAAEKGLPNPNSNNQELPIQDNVTKPKQVMVDAAAECQIATAHMKMINHPNIDLAINYANTPKVSTLRANIKGGLQGLSDDQINQVIHGDRADISCTSNSPVEYTSQAGVIDLVYSQRQRLDIFTKVADKSNYNISWCETRARTCQEQENKAVPNCQEGGEWDVGCKEAPLVSQKIASEAKDYIENGTGGETILNKAAKWKLLPKTAENDRSGW